jgi:aspartate/methionine/tyrosine aminotransferase
MKTPRVMESAYMQWAKKHVHVSYNLAVSGLTSYPLSELPVTMADLEITGNSYYGYPPLQEALARHCGTGTDRVFASIGTSLANHIAMAVLAAPGDEILIEDPGYELIVAAAQYLGANVVRFPRRREDDFRVDPQEIARRVTPATKLIVLTNLHNPSSAFIDDATLAEVGRVAARAGARVLVDEVYLDAAFDRRPRSSAHLGPQFVVTSSLTKVYGLSGLRCGWVVAEPELVARMWHLNDLYSGIPSHATERMSVVALAHLPHIRAWARGILDENRARARELLLPRADIECFFPDAGTVVFPRLKKGSVEGLYRHLTERYDTAVVPGRFFGMEDHFRVGFGGKPELFLKGLRNLCSALDTLPA